MARGPPVAELDEQLVSRVRRARVGLELVVPPASSDLGGVPRSTGENSGGVRHDPNGTVPSVPRRRKHWGWGFEDEQPSHDDVRAAAAALSDRLGFGSADPDRPVPLSEVSLPEPRLHPPERLKAICSTRHIRTLPARLRACLCRCASSVPGALRPSPGRRRGPRTEDEVAAVLEWAVGAGAAVIPFGGGTSVVGGVEPRVGERYAGVVTIDLKALDRVLEVDPTSLAARIQARRDRPRARAAARRARLTLRHFPQSFQFSTLGGWIATRAGGHFATLYTHIDDLVESVRALTPVGLVGVAPPAGLGRGRLAGPDAVGLGGHPRLDHRGVGAGPAAPGPPCLGRGRVRRPSRRERRPCGRSRSPGCTPAIVG